MTSRDSVKKFLLDSYLKTDAIDIRRSSGDGDGYSMQIKKGDKSYDLEGNYKAGKNPPFVYELTDSKKKVHKANLLIDIFRLLLKREGFTQSEINKINQAVKFHEREIIKVNKGDSVVGDASYFISRTKDLIELKGLPNGNNKYNVKIEPGIGKMGAEFTVLSSESPRVTYYHGLKAVMRGLKNEHRMSSNDIKQFHSALKDDVKWALHG